MVYLKLCYADFDQNARTFKTKNLILKPRVGEVDVQVMWSISYGIIRKRDRVSERERVGHRERSPQLCVTSETCTHMKNDKRSTCTSIMILRTCLHTYNDDGNDRR